MYLFSDDRAGGITVTHLNYTGTLLFLLWFLRWPLCGLVLYVSCGWVWLCCWSERCRSTHLQHVECNQHLLLYPDLSSAWCQIIVVTSSVWSDQNQLLSRSPPGLQHLCHPTQPWLPDPASHVNRKSPPAPHWEPSTCARAHHHTLPTNPSYD